MGGRVDGQFFVFLRAEKRKFSRAARKMDACPRAKEQKKKKLRDISGCEHLDSARAAEVSDGRQSEQAVAHLSSTHSIILLFFSLHPLHFSHFLAVTMIRRRRQSDHVSRARAHLVSSSPRRASLCMRTTRVAGPRCCLQALTRGQRSPPALFLMRRWVEGTEGPSGCGHPESRQNLN